MEFPTIGIEEVDGGDIENCGILAQLPTRQGGARVGGIAGLDLDEHPLGAYLHQQIGADVELVLDAVDEDVGPSRELAGEDSVAAIREPAFGEPLGGSGVCHAPGEDEGLMGAAQAKGEPGRERAEEEGAKEEQGELVDGHESVVEW